MPVPLSTFDLTLQQTTVNVIGCLALLQVVHNVPSLHHFSCFFGANKFLGTPHTLINSLL